MFHYYKNANSPLEPLSRAGPISKNLVELLRRAVDRVFGYDFFVSYAHADGRNYPTVLEQELRRAGFSVFLDTTIYVAGEDLRLATRRRVRMSRKLLLIARPAALMSEWVWKEVSVHLEANKTPIIVNINHAVESAETGSRLATIASERYWLRIEEWIDNPDGTPTDHCLQEIGRSFNATRQETRRLRLFAAAAVILVILAIGALMGAIVAKLQRDHAFEQLRRTQSSFLVSFVQRVIEGANSTRANLDEVLLLAAQAIELHDTPAARGAFLRYWNTIDTDLHAYLWPKNQDVRALSFGPEGKTLAIGTELWDLVHNVPIETSIAISPGSCSSGPKVVFDRNGGRTIAFCSDRTVTVTRIGRGDTMEIRVVQDNSQDQITSIALSPNGDLAATGTASGALQLWRVDNGAARFAVQGAHTNRIVDLAFDAQGKVVVSVGADKILQTWDADRGVRLGQPIQTDVYALTVAVHPTGQTIAVGGGSPGAHAHEGTVQLWNVVTQELGQPFFWDEPGTVARALAFSPDGRYLAIGTDFPSGAGRYGNLALVDLMRENEMRSDVRLRGQEGPFVSLAFNDDGTILASGIEGNGVVLWHLGHRNTIKSRLLEDESAVSDAAFSQDGKSIAVGHSDGSIRIVGRGCAARERVPRPGHQGAVTAMVFSFDGRLLATGTNDGTVTLWDAMSDLEIVASTTAHTGPITGIAFGPSAKTLVTGSNKDEHLVQWEIAPDRSLAVRNKLLLIHEDAPLIYEGGAWNVISTPNGQLLAAGTGASTVALWDLAKGVRLPEIELSQEYSDVTGLSFSSQDGMLAVARGTGLVNLYSLEQNRWVGRLATSGFVPRNPAWQDRVLSIAYTSNGRILVGGLSSGHVVLWDTDGMVEIGHLIGSTSSMKKVVASPDGQTLIGIDSDNRAIRWEMNFRDLACRIANRSLSDSELRRYLGPDGLLPMDQRVCHR